jgi:protein-disulfide isomerase
MERLSGGARRLFAVSLLVGIAGCGNTQSRQPESSAQAGSSDVVATVNGEPITAADVRQGLGASLAKVEEQAYRMKKEQIDTLIAERLLAAEAKRRGMSVDALIEQEVTRKIAPVTQTDVDAFVASNRSRINGDPASLAPQIRAYLTSQSETTARQAYVDSLRANAKVDVHLAAPALFRVSINAKGFPIRGSEAAPVTIVEFSDFHCPYCRSVQPTLTQLLAKYPGKVRLVYRHFPLDSLHPQARRAAEASWCAAEQNKFWPFHDRVYANRPDAGAETLSRLAGEAGLDVSAFNTCVASGRAAAAVESDAEEGARNGITGTPGFFINGRPLSGSQPMSAFEAIIDEELSGTR